MVEVRRSSAQIESAGECARTAEVESRRELHSLAVEGRSAYNSSMRMKESQERMPSQTGLIVVLRG